MTTQPGSNDSAAIWLKDETKNKAGVADYRAVMKVRRRPLKSQSYVPCVTWDQMKKNKDKYYERLANFAAMKGSDQNGDIMAPPAPETNKTQADVRQLREFEQLYVSFKDRPYYCGIKATDAAKAKELVAGGVICRDALKSDGNLNDGVTKGAKRKLTSSGDTTNDACAAAVNTEMVKKTSSTWDYDGKVIANHYMVYKASSKLCFAVYTTNNCETAGFKKDVKGVSFGRVVRKGDYKPLECLKDGDEKLDINKDEWANNAYKVKGDNNKASNWLPKKGVICKPMKTFEQMYPDCVYGTSAHWKASARSDGEKASNAILAKKVNEAMALPVLEEVIPPAEITGSKQDTKMCKATMTELLPFKAANGTKAECIKLCQEKEGC